MNVHQVIESGLWKGVFIHRFHCSCIYGNLLEYLGNTVNFRQVHCVISRDLFDIKTFYAKGMSDPHEIP